MILLGAKTSKAAENEIPVGAILPLSGALASYGRTTLNGEGLQHQDGHGLLLAATYPTCRAYDPAFAYEMAVIVHDGLKRMYQHQHNVFYYITAMNENYHHPAMPKGAEEGILKGMYMLKESKVEGCKVQLMGSGTILREVMAAADLLKSDFNIESDIWSMTSINELAREASDITRWNQLHPTKKAKQSYIGKLLSDRKGPAIIATDYTQTYSDQIRAYVPMQYTVLGTDGFGRSDTRTNLRTFFEVNRYYVVVAALKALSDDGEIESKVVQQAIKKYNIDPEKPNPLKV